MAARGWGLDQDRNTESEAERGNGCQSLEGGRETHSWGWRYTYTETDTQGETRRLSNGDRPTGTEGGSRQRGTWGTRSLLLPSKDWPLQLGSLYPGKGFIQATRSLTSTQIHTSRAAAECTLEARTHRSQHPGVEPHLGKAQDWKARSHGYRHLPEPL